MDLEKDQNGCRRDQFSHVVVQLRNAGASCGSGGGDGGQWLRLRCCLEKPNGQQLLARYDVGPWRRGSICSMWVRGRGVKRGVGDISVLMHTVIQAPVRCPSWEDRGVCFFM